MHLNIFMNIILFCLNFHVNTDCCFECRKEPVQVQTLLDSRVASVSGSPTAVETTVGGHLSMRTLAT